MPQLRGYEREPVTTGQSTSMVYRLTSPAGPPLFLKVATGVDADERYAEHERLRWLAGRVPVPSVVGFAVTDGTAYLLTEGLPGIDAAEAPAHLWRRVTTAFATALRELHAIDPSQCPFDRTLDQVLPLARARAVAGRVDEADFDAERRGQTAIALLGPLYAERPGSEDIVVTHGDACLPNVVVDGGSFSGFVDCGRCGRADRYQDLALAVRSITHNFGASFATAFFDAYGIERVDTAKVAYYRLVDEFF